MSMPKAILITVSGRLETGVLSITEDCWLFQWSGGKIAFTPPTCPGHGVIGNEALKRFLAEELPPREIVPQIYSRFPPW